MSTVQTSDLALLKYYDRSAFSARTDADGMPSRRQQDAAVAETPSALGAGAATIVQLSDQAKAMMAKAQTDQAAADKLDAQLRGPSATPDKKFVPQNAVYLRMADQIIALEDRGESGKAQVLRDAFNASTIKIENAADGPEFNLTYETKHAADAGVATSSRILNPAGAIKQVLDKGNAPGTGGGDRGVSYST